MSITVILFVIVILWLAYKSIFKIDDRNSNSKDSFSKSQNEYFENEDEYYSPLYESRKETEEAAMNAVEQFERENYRKIKDVSHQNVGYDIRSWKSKEKRYIEVKGRKSTGNIYITRNEWKAAQKLGYEYFLYVVYHCDTDEPELRVTQNPVRSLSPTYISKTKNYKVTKSDIVRHSTAYYYKI